jgi:hypothetical protein
MGLPNTHTRGRALAFTLLTVTCTTRNFSFSRLLISVGNTLHQYRRDVT